MSNLQSYKTPICGPFQGVPRNPLFKQYNTNIFIYAYKNSHCLSSPALTLQLLSEFLLSPNVDTTDLKKRMSRMVFPKIYQAHSLMTLPTNLWLAQNHSLHNYLLSRNLHSNFLHFSSRCYKQFYPKPSWVSDSSYNAATCLSGF